MYLVLDSHPYNWNDEIYDKLIELGFTIDDSRNWFVPEDWDCYETLGRNIIIRDQYDRRRIKIDKNNGIYFYEDE